MSLSLRVTPNRDREHISSHHPHTNGNNPISTNINNETYKGKI